MAAQNFITIDIEAVTNTCFVAMPFQAVFESEYEKVIKPAVQANGLECVRGDEIYTRQSIVEDIWRSIRRARIVVAEISGRNPNVMYEMGLAHAIGKPIVLLTRDQADVPFDLKTLRYVYYDIAEPDWGTYLGDQLARLIQKILETPDVGKHLSGVEVRTQMPELPTAPVQANIRVGAGINIAGVWTGSWLSVRKERKHEATLVIPNNHGSSFMASMTVQYTRENQVTRVHETLSGTINDGSVVPAGVAYTYIDQGSSAGYSLDSFALKLESLTRLVGKVSLRHGERPIVFERVQEIRSS